MLKTPASVALFMLFSLSGPVWSQPISDNAAAYVPNYVMPAVPKGSPASAFEKARDASIIFTKAHCSLSDAHRQAALNDYDGANKSIAEALAELDKASVLFRDTVKLIRSETLIVPPGTGGDASNEKFKEYGYERPTTYGGAFQTISSAVASERKRITNLKFSGNAGDYDVLRTITMEQGIAVEIFNAITDITISGLK